MILDTNTNTILNTDRDIILNTNTYLYVFTKQGKLDYSDNVSNLLVSMMIRMVNVMMIIRRNKERHDDDIGGFNDDDVYNDNEDKADKVKNNNDLYMIGGASMYYVLGYPKKKVVPSNFAYTS